MADLRARLLAILKDPDRFTGKHTTPFLPGGSKYFVVDTTTGTETEVSHSYKIAEVRADLNARHRLKRLCEETAKVAREFPETPAGAYAGLMMTACRATSKDIAGEILALGEDNDHS